MMRANRWTRELKGLLTADEGTGEGDDSAPAIEMDGVGFQYGTGEPVLRDIMLKIDGPGLYCVVGPNGVGKSTLVKCMSKIYDATSGEIRLYGRDIRDMRHKEVANIVGYVPVVANDVFSMSVVETIMIGCGKHESTESKIRSVYKAMKMMMIEDLGSKMFNELSAGQHQRVSIARGLVQKPRILVLDEPTANLDVKYQVYVAELLRALAENERIVVMMISHDLNISAKYAHRIIMMGEPGVIHKIGTPEEVITQKNVEEIYGIHCKVVQDDDWDVPVVILGQSMLGEMKEAD